MLFERMFFNMVGRDRFGTNTTTYVVILRGRIGTREGDEMGNRFGNTYKGTRGINSKTTPWVRGLIGVT